MNHGVSLSIPFSAPPQLNIANPATGAQKLIDVEDEHKVRIFYEKRISQEVEGDALGDEFKGYVFRITGGNDKQGFPMLQGMSILLGRLGSCALRLSFSRWGYRFTDRQDRIILRNSIISGCGLQKL